MLYFVSRVLSSKNFPRAKDAKKNDGITTSRKIFFFRIWHLLPPSTGILKTGDVQINPLISGLVQRYTEQDYTAATYEVVSA